MVNKAQHIVTSADPDQTSHFTAGDKSLMRWLRQCFYMPWLSSRYFNSTARAAITQAVQDAEVGHACEIQVVIEGCLPLSSAYYQNTIGRARTLFGALGVWDTAFNSGVLLYVNLCERRVEIVADRGIHQYVNAGQWQEICNNVTMQLAQGAFSQGVINGVEQIGQTVRGYYKAHNIDVGNELRDVPLFL